MALTFCPIEFVAVISILKVLPQSTTLSTVKVKCVPDIQRELDRIHVAIDIDNELIFTSMRMEVQEMADRAYLKGNEYGDGYIEGFNEGYCVAQQLDSERTNLIHRKYEELEGRWGLR